MSMWSEAPTTVTAIRSALPIMHTSTSIRKDPTVEVTRWARQPRTRDPWGLDLPTLPRKPWYVRWSAQVAAHALVSMTELLMRVFRRARGQTVDARSNGRGKHVILTGTFHADKWLEAHVRPIAASPACERLTIVADKPMLTIPKVTYECPPGWLQRVIGRVLSRSLWYVLSASRYRPDLCGGFHLLCNGLLALATARLIGARSFYFSVGGRTEIIAGGAFGENKVFGCTCRQDKALEAALLRLANQSDFIVTMGSGGRRFLYDRGVSAPIHVIPGGISHTNLVRDLDTKTYDVIVVCRLVPIKRLDVFLEAISIARQSMPAIKAVIVGDGAQRQWLREIVVGRQLEDNVEFAGHRNDVSSWLSKSRVFMLTSDSEGLALSVMEAMMAGLPCVVSRVGDLGDLVIDGVNGFLVPRREAAVFACKLVELLTDRPKLISFSMEACRRASSVGLACIAAKWTTLLGNQNGMTP